MGQRYPLPVTAAMLTPAYVPVITYVGGERGDDPGNNEGPDGGQVSRANATNDFAPHSQYEKLQSGGVYAGNGFGEDITRNRGWIAPGQPAAAKPAAGSGDPVVSSIAPTTGAASTLPLTVTITGLRFTPYSQVYTGGSATPDVSAKYISATQMQVAIFKATPGTVSVAVMDHGVMSNTDKLFTVT